jgi:hypothetical protein
MDLAQQRNFIGQPGVGGVMPYQSAGAVAAPTGRFRLRPTALVGYRLYEVSQLARIDRLDQVARETFRVGTLPVYVPAQARYRDAGESLQVGKFADLFCQRVAVAAGKDHFGEKYVGSISLCLGEGLCRIAGRLHINAPEAQEHSGTVGHVCAGIHNQDARRGTWLLQSARHG